MKLQTVLNALFTKVDDTEKRYEKALEEKQELLIEVTAELTEKQAGLKDLHKMAILGDVSESTYQKEADAVEMLQNRVSEIQREMQLIQEYKTDDVKAVLAEMDAKQNELASEKASELASIQLDLLKAKYDYLTKLVDGKKRYDELHSPPRKVEALKHKLGMKNRLDYIGNSFSLSVYNGKFVSYESLKIEQAELYEALSSGKISYNLQLELKNKGIIEN